MDLPGVPKRLMEELREAAVSVGIKRLALVGGVVRDHLLHQRFGRDWVAFLILTGLWRKQTCSPQSWFVVVAQIA